MAVTSVMSSLAEPPTSAAVRSDWTMRSHVSFLLDFRRVNHGLMSMTSIVHWVLYRLGGQYSYFNIKWNKMPRIRVNKDVASA